MHISDIRLVRIMFSRSGSFYGRFVEAAAHECLTVAAELIAMGAQYVCLSNKLTDNEFQPTWNDAQDWEYDKDGIVSLSRDAKARS